MELAPLASYVVGWTAVAVLVLAIVALLCCLFIADPKPPRRRFCPDCGYETPEDGFCTRWSCHRVGERVPWSQR